MKVEDPGSAGDEGRRSRQRRAEPYTRLHRPIRLASRYCTAPVRASHFASSMRAEDKDRQVGRPFLRLTPGCMPNAIQRNSKFLLES
jgi:hypothetical protein